MIATSKATRHHDKSPVEAASKRIAATVLLSGSVRPTPFSAAIERSLLDLPCSQEQTLLAAWQEHVAALVGQFPGVSPLIRVLTGQDGPVPTVSNTAVHGGAVEISRDLSTLRGTGGILRDIAAAYHPDEFLLVANAAQILLWPMVRLVSTLFGLEADIAMIAHQDGAPVTFMLVRCACLRELPEVGFIDLKEQALPEIRKRHLVRVAPMSFHVCCGVRTAEDYLLALRSSHITNNGQPLDPLAEKWQSEFQVVEAGANVAAGVRLHNSVVLKGAEIGHDAVLVRSVACPGAVVRPGAVLVDTLISAAGVLGTSAGAS